MAFTASASAGFQPRGAISLEPSGIESGPRWGPRSPSAMARSTRTGFASTESRQDSTKSGLRVGFGQMWESFGQSRAELDQAWWPKMLKEDTTLRGSCGPTRRAHGRREARSAVLGLIVGTHDSGFGRCCLVPAPMLVAEPIFGVPTRPALWRRDPENRLRGQHRSQKKGVSSGSEP